MVKFCSLRQGLVLLLQHLILVSKSEQAISEAHLIWPAKQFATLCNKGLRKAKTRLLRPSWTSAAENSKLEVHAKWWRHHGRVNDIT